jgi:hypothetical protein
MALRPGGRAVQLSQSCHSERPQGAKNHGYARRTTLAQWRFFVASLLRMTGPGDAHQELNSRGPGGDSNLTAKTQRTPRLHPWAECIRRRAEPWVDKVLNLRYNANPSSWRRDNVAGRRSSTCSRASVTGPNGRKVKTMQGSPRTNRCWTVTHSVYDPVCQIGAEPVLAALLCFRSSFFVQQRREEFPSPAPRQCPSRCLG